MAIDLVTIEGFMACISLAIIVIMLLVSLFVGADSDIDIDGDGDANFDLSGLITPKGILQFICGYSWYLVLIKPYHGGTWFWYDWLIGFVIGLAVMTVMALLYWGMSKLSHETKFEKGEDLVGRTGTISAVNVNVPGAYWIMTTVNSTMSEIKVKSKSGRTDLKVGDTVIIESCEGENYFIN